MVEKRLKSLMLSRPDPIPRVWFRQSVITTDIYLRLACETKTTKEEFEQDVRYALQCL